LKETKGISALKTLKTLKKRRKEEKKKRVPIKKFNIKNLIGKSFLFPFSPFFLKKI